jgi:CBS domain-containing protein
MTADVVTCPSTATFADVAQMMKQRDIGNVVLVDGDVMRERAIRRLPVVEKGMPVGIVSLGDLAIERDSDSALADISAAPADE